MFFQTVDYSPDCPPRRFKYHKKHVIHWGTSQRAAITISFRLQRRIGIGFEFRADGPHADTPLDATFYLFWLSLYLSTSLGRRLNRWLIGDRHGSREIALQAYLADSKHPTHIVVTWGLWTDPDDRFLSRWQKAKRSRWYRVRRGYTRPIGWLLDVILGKEQHALEVLEEMNGAVAWLPEGGYPLLLKVEQATWKRPRACWRIVRTSVDYRVLPTDRGGPGYCPTGREKYGSDDGLVAASVEINEADCRHPEKWMPAAVADFTRRVLSQRATYAGIGWQPDSGAGVLTSTPATH